MKLLNSFKFIDAFYNYVNNKINLNELENIIYSYKFKIITFVGRICTALRLGLSYPMDKQVSMLC